MNDIEITEKAVNQVRNMMTEDDKGFYLRTFIVGGGCAGFEYGFTFDDTIAEDDYIIDHNDVKVAIDSLSFQYLSGSTIDYESSLMGSRFIINNPNATTTCGCGSSFSI